MAQQATANTGESAPQQAPLYVVRIEGRIIGKPRSYQDRHGKKAYATLMALPAPDRWSSASTVEVQSGQQLGQDGDEWRGSCRVSGTARPFKYKDANGDDRVGQDVTIRLHAVE